MMNVTRRRHKITILAATANRNSKGENIQQWNPILTTWASIDQLHGRMLALAQAHTSTELSTHQITTRYNPKIKETCRVLYQPDATQPGTTYTITSVRDPETRRRVLILLCQVVKA